MAFCGQWGHVQSGGNQHGLIASKPFLFLFLLGAKEKQAPPEAAFAFLAPITSKQAARQPIEREARVCECGRVEYESKASAAGGGRKEENK